MFVVVSDVDSNHSLSGCERLGLSVTRQWFVHEVFVQLDLTRYGLQASLPLASRPLPRAHRAGWM